MAGVTGRFAPSPSGRMHLGNLLCSLLAWLSAKHEGRQIACCTAWGDKIFGNLGELSEYDLVLDKLQTIALGEDCDDIKGLTNGSATLLKNGGLAIDLNYVTRLYPWDRI